VFESGGISVVGFYGQFETTLDPKGRFNVPVRLRSINGPDGNPHLDGNLIITKGLDGCLGLYPEPEWETIQERLAAQNSAQKSFRYFSRRFYSSAALVSADKAGRILVPSYLIEEAKLRKEILIIGVNRWIEIWDPVRYQYYLEQHSGSYEEAAEQVFSLNAPPHVSSGGS
jgi:MraZ protein